MSQEMWVMTRAKAGTPNLRYDFVHGSLSTPLRLRREEPHG